MNQFRGVEKAHGAQKIAVQPLVATDVLNG